MVMVPSGIASSVTVSTHFVGSLEKPVAFRGWFFSVEHPNQFLHDRLPR